MSRDLLTRLSSTDLAWAVKGLQRYVKGRHIDANFVELLAHDSTPGALIEPNDPVYGDEVLAALLAALRDRVAQRLRAKPHEKADEQTRELILRHIPECVDMMQALEALSIGYRVTRFTIDGCDHLS